MMILATFFSWLFPSAAAAAAAPATPSVQKVAQNSNHSQQLIPMAVKDGKAAKLRPKTP